MNRLDCNLDDNFIFIDSKTYNQMQFDIYEDQTQIIAFVYINPETGCLKENIYGPQDKYFYHTLDEISYYFDTHKAVETYLELCSRELEEQKKYLERIEYYE